MYKLRHAYILYSFKNVRFILKHKLMNINLLAM